MIPTRQHALIDYGVAALLAGLAASGRRSPGLRRLLGDAAAYHAGYSVLTDYEGGLRPVLDMRGHLALDFSGAAALCGAALLRGELPRGERGLLLGLGLAEIAVIAASAKQPISRPGLAGVPGAAGALYPPLDVPKPVARDLFIVDSRLPGLLGHVLPIRMTVIRLPGGDLLLHSPTRFSLGLRRELEKLGRIRHLVAPNIAHWTLLGDWQRACPDAVTWAAPGLRQRRQVRRSGLRIDRELGAATPPEWDGIRLVPVPGGFGFHEVALFHEDSGTLVLTDLVLSLQAEKLPAPLRWPLRLAGMVAPDAMPPPYVRAVVRLGGHPAAAAAARLVALRPRRVIFAHGRWFAADATPALRRALRWLLPATRPSAGPRSAPAHPTARSVRDPVG